MQEIKLNFIKNTFSLIKLLISLINDILSRSSGDLQKNNSN